MSCQTIFFVKIVLTRFFLGRTVEKVTEDNMDTYEFVFWMLIVCAPVLGLMIFLAAAFPRKVEDEDPDLWGSQDVDQRTKR
jgi:hypothetical protein